MAYSQDFRDKVLEVKQQENLTISSTAKRFCIGTTTLKHWLKNPMLKTTKNRATTKIDLEALKAHIDSKPDLIIMSAPMILTDKYKKILPEFILALL